MSWLKRSRRVALGTTGCFLSLGTSFTDWKQTPGNRWKGGGRVFTGTAKPLRKMRWPTHSEPPLVPIKENICPSSPCPRRDRGLPGEAAPPARLCSEGAGSSARHEFLPPPCLPRCPARRSCSGGLAPRLHPGPGTDRPGQAREPERDLCRAAAQRLRPGQDPAPRGRRGEGRSEAASQQSPGSSDIPSCAPLTSSSPGWAGASPSPLTNRPRNCERPRRGAGGCLREMLREDAGLAMTPGQWPSSPPDPKPPRSGAMRAVPEQRWHRAAAREAAPGRAASRSIRSAGRAHRASDQLSRGPAPQHPRPQRCEEAQRRGASVFGELRPQRRFPYLAGTAPGLKSDSLRH